jgi:aryl-alcohol dehydrogenase-like predicted oxidoreductase
MRILGSVGLVSSAIGLGTLAFTGAYGPVTKRECSKAIHVALDIGVTMFDTAGYYSRGGTERLLGKALAQHRSEAVIATGGGQPAGAPGNQAAVDRDPARLAVACDASLRRLNTDYIDLFYLSRVDPQVPVEDSVGKLAELVAAGKIRYLGLAGASADQLRRAHAVHPISALAVEYSLRQRSAEQGPLATAAELGVGVVACGPLGHGLLKGGAAAGVSADEQAALRAVEAEAAELDLGIARIALAWLLAQRDDIVPVPSTRCPAHLEMNASVSGIRLAPEICARLARLFPL